MFAQCNIQQQPPDSAGEMLTNDVVLRPTCILLSLAAAIDGYQLMEHVNTAASTGDLKSKGRSSRAAHGDKKRSYQEEARAQPPC